MKNPYTTLGLESNASDDEIKKAYRRLAKEHHPDRTQGDDSKFKEVAEAYETLSDPIKKSQWNRQSPFGREDQFYEDFLRGQGFNDMFNNRYGWSSDGKGQDVKAAIQITIRDAYFGCSRELNIGLRTVNVKIPCGITHGQKLRLKGLGQKAMKDDMNGDLILTIHLIEDANFYLDNNGLHTVARIDAIEAIVGGKGSVTVFDKTINYTIPQYTQNGVALRVRGKGFTKYNKPDEFGDLYINVVIKMPSELTDDEMDKLKQVKESINGRNE